MSHFDMLSTEVASEVMATAQTHLNAPIHWRELNAKCFLFHLVPRFAFRNMLKFSDRNVSRIVSCFLKSHAIIH